MSKSSVNLIKGEAKKPLLERKEEKSEIQNIFHSTHLINLIFYELRVEYKRDT